jgi:hypothetical protein
VSTYRRLRTPDDAGVTVRQDGREVRLSVGSGQRLRCNTTEAWAVLAGLADTLGAVIDVATVPDWVVETPIEVSDK